MAEVRKTKPTMQKGTPKGCDLRETFWGYVVRPGYFAVERAAYGEMVAGVLAVLLAIAAYAQWLLPGSINSIEVLPFKIMGTVVFALFSSFLYLIARRGLCPEVQIDTQRQEIRTARRNRHGAATQTGCYPFQDIESVYIKRNSALPGRDKLCINPGENAPLIEVAVGRGKDLEQIMARLGADLQQGIALKQPRLKQPRSSTKAMRARSAFSTQYTQ